MRWAQRRLAPPPQSCPPSQAGAAQRPATRGGEADTSKLMIACAAYQCRFAMLALSTDLEGRCKHCTMMHTLQTSVAVPEL
jgi:hypothetical protein